MLTPDLLEILDYVENFDEKGYQCAVIGTIGRSGSMLLHSFLDSHPEVLHVPIFLYYYSDWEYTLQHSAPEQLVDDFFTKSESLHGKIPDLGPNRDVELDLRFDEIKALMKALLPYLSSVNRKTFILLFHFVYAKLFGLDLSQIKVFLLHNHSVPNIFGYFSYVILKERFTTLEDLEPLFNTSPLKYVNSQDFFLDNVLNDFPNMKFILTIRDPLPIVYATGEFKEGGNFVIGDLALRYWSIYHMLLGYFNLYALKQKLGERVTFVKFEDLHTQTEALLNHLTEFLGIGYHEALQSSTFGGHLWSGSFATKKVLWGTNPNMIEEQKKWQTDMDEQTRYFFITLCNPLARAFGYVPYEVPAQSYDLTHFLNYEKKTYQFFPKLQMTYLKKVFDLVDEHLEPKTNFSEPFELGVEAWIQNELDIFQQKLGFWLHYAPLRQKAVQALLQAGGELNQYPPIKMAL